MIRYSIASTLISTIVTSHILLACGDSSTGFGDADVPNIHNEVQGKFDGLALGHSEEDRKAREQALGEILVQGSLKGLISREAVKKKLWDDIWTNIPSETEDKDARLVAIFIQQGQLDPNTPIAKGHGETLPLIKLVGRWQSSATGNKAVLNALLKSPHISVDATNTPEGATALWLAAARHSDPEVLKLLLAAGANPNLVYKHNGTAYTPLAYAEQQSNGAMISALREAQKAWKEE